MVFVDKGEKAVEDERVCSRSFCFFIGGRKITFCTQKKKKRNERGMSFYSFSIDVCSLYESGER